MRNFVVIALWFLTVAAGLAQDLTDFIVIDQFGYLPDSRKVAVIRDPQVGFDADQDFDPGSWYALVDAASGELVYRAKPLSWKNGLSDGNHPDSNHS